MKRFLVIGDSYALCDQNHSHWFALWAAKHGHVTTFAGLAGGNHVNIAANLEQHDILDHDGVVYHFTSLLRAEGVRLPMQNAERDNAIINLMTRSYQGRHVSSQWLHQCLGSTVEQRVETDGEYFYHAQNVIPYFYSPVTGVDLLDIDDDTRALANNFYRNVSPRWLVRANWMAFENVMLKLSSRGMPTLVALPPCGGFDFVESKLILPRVTVWNMSNSRQLAPLPHSNHIALVEAEFFAEEFQKICNMRSVF
jgi:hypothetical protein